MVNNSILHKYAIKNESLPPPPTHKYCYFEAYPSKVFKIYVFTYIF